MRFDDVVAGHLEWIARLAFRFCRSKADAEDLAQETICRIYANRDKFDNARDLKPWALTIMTNIAKTQYIRQSCVPFVRMDDSYDKPATTRADSEANYHDIFEAIHRSARISVGVQCVMLYADGYTYDEIAEIVGINPGTVKSRISAGRTAIRKALAWYLACQWLTDVKVLVLA